MEAEINFYEFGEGPPEWVVQNPHTQEPDEFINLNRAAKVIHVDDARGSDLSFRKDGIQFINDDYSVNGVIKDFYKQKDLLNSVYEREVEDVLTEHTGCDHAEVYNGNLTLRTTDPEVKKQLQLKGAADFVHGDFAPDAIHNVLKREFGEEKHKQFTSKYKRFMIVNLWRPHKNVVYDVPMSFLLNSKEERERGNVRKIQRTSRYEEGKSVSFIEAGRWGEEQKWISFKNMTPDECVIFKTADSEDVNSGIAHAASRDVNAPEGCPYRHSIEARAFIFFKEMDF